MTVDHLPLGPKSLCRVLRVLSGVYSTRLGFTVVTTPSLWDQMCGDGVSSGQMYHGKESSLISSPKKRLHRRRPWVRVSGDSEVTGHDGRMERDVTGCGPRPLTRDLTGPATDRSGWTRVTDTSAGTATSLPWAPRLSWTTFDGYGTSGSTRDLLSGQKESVQHLEESSRDPSGISCTPRRDPDNPTRPERHPKKTCKRVRLRGRPRHTT